VAIVPGAGDIGISRINGYHSHLDMACIMSMKEGYTVLWWVPQGHHPTIKEAKTKLTQLREHGPGSEAFTFKQSFDAPSFPDTTLLIDST